MKSTPIHFGDPCFKYPDWLNLTPTRSETEFQALQSFALPSTDLSKIEIVFPVSWIHLAQKIADQGFTRCLDQLSLSFKKIYCPPTNYQHISAHVKNIDQLKPILTEQADYHNHLYPDYYQKFDELIGLNKINRPPYFYEGLLILD